MFVSVAVQNSVTLIRFIALFLVHCPVFIVGGSALMDKIVDYSDTYQRASNKMFLFPSSTCGKVAPLKVVDLGSNVPSCAIFSAYAKLLANKSLKLPFMGKHALKQQS